MVSDTRPTFALVLILCFAVVPGCTLTLVADYDEEMTNRIMAVAHKIDRFWGRLLDTPADERSYREFADQYNDIESDLTMLHMRNRIRPMNERSTRQAEIALELWQEDRALHREQDAFSDFEARRHREQFRRILLAMARGEEARDMESGRVDP